MADKFGLEMAIAGSPGWSESASVAHIYGQNLVAAESLTAIGDSFAFAPEN